MKAARGNRFPGTIQQLRNATVAAARAVGAAVAGRSVIVPDYIRVEREVICASCEENLAGRCRKCGCGVRAQWIRKTHLATEQCPLEPPKWLKWS